MFESSENLFIIFVDDYVTLIFEIYLIIPLLSKYYNTLLKGKMNTYAVLHTSYRYNLLW